MLLLLNSDYGAWCHQKKFKLVYSLPKLELQGIRNVYQAVFTHLVLKLCKTKIYNIHRLQLTLQTR